MPTRNDQLSPTLVHGDCLDAMADIPDGAVDLVIADLPFGITGQEWDTALCPDDLWPHLNRICKHNAAILIFACGMMAAKWMLSNEAACRNKLIWKKRRATGHLNSNKMHMRAFEEILVFYRALPTFNPQRRQGFNPYFRKNEGKNWSSMHWGSQKSLDSGSADGSRCPIDVLEFPGRGFTSTHHPTEKPLNLLSYLIRTYSNPGELVLDPTCGSGSTLVAARQLGRRSIGIEKDPEFFNVAERRLAATSDNGEDNQQAAEQQHGLSL